MSVLHVERSGRGPALVLLHPVGLNGDTWLPVTAALERNWTVYRIDLPGHGRSALAEVAPNLDSYADAVVQAILAQVSRPFVLMGLSFGGMIAQTIAVRRPKELAALILCGCGCTFPEGARRAVRDRGLQAMAAGMAFVVDQTVERWFTEAFAASPIVEEVRQQPADLDPRSWLSAWTAISQLNTKLKLGLIEVPTLCIAGELDKGSPPMMVQDLAGAIPMARYVELHGAPHMMQLETTAALVAAVRPFLDELGPAMHPQQPDVSPIG